MLCKDWVLRVGEGVFVWVDGLGGGGFNGDLGLL